MLARPGNEALAEWAQHFPPQARCSEALAERVQTADNIMNLIPGRFGTYELTDKEEKQGQILTPLNKCVLQNLMAESADLILDSDIPSDPVELERYKAQVMFAQARIRVITELLGSSSAAENYLLSTRDVVEQFQPSGNIYDQFRINPNQGE